MPRLSQLNVVKQSIKQPLTVTNLFYIFVIERVRQVPTLSLVPTPSVPDTRIGSMKPAAFRSNSPAKPPSSALQPGGIENNGEIYSRVRGEGTSGMYNVHIFCPVWSILSIFFSFQPNFRILPFILRVYQGATWPWPGAWSCPPVCCQRRCQLRCLYRSDLYQGHS